MNKQEIRDQIRKKYGTLAVSDFERDKICNPGVKKAECCNGENQYVGNISELIGYSSAEIKEIPELSNMGLGCGNPLAIAAISEGEYVLDLGSGGGIDVFLASGRVGKTGKVIGVDMTLEMIIKARNNAKNIDSDNIEFRLGEIENLPIDDNYIDVIISNCVINLSPDKEKVFSEAYRVLKPGGRLAISDIVAKKEIPEILRANQYYYSACMSGASTIETLISILNKSGFEKIEITPKSQIDKVIKLWAPEKGISDYIFSATIEAKKPLSKHKPDYF